MEKELEELKLHISKLHFLHNLFWKEFMFTASADKEESLELYLIVSQQLRFLDNQYEELMKKIRE